MTLLDLHVELALTNELLKRIADALDRAVPMITPPDHTKHPLIGLSDISRFSPAHAAAVDSDRATLPFRASDRFHPTGSAPTAPEPSVTGLWDHDDPLDQLDESYSNYAGVDT